MRLTDIRKRIDWVARKVASRDVSYLVRRLSYSLRKRLVDWCFSSSWLERHAVFSLTASEGKECGLRDYFERRRQPSWHFDLEAIPGIVARVPDPEKVRTIAEAEAIIQRRFTLRGHKAVTLDPMDWGHVPAGALDWTGELNRHAFFEQLGFAYRYTSEERFAQAFIELSSSWIDQNSRRLGKLEWDKPLHVARRINAWIWSFFLFIDNPLWTEPAQRRFLHVLGLLAEYLHQTLEYHSPGNHVLLEAKTLAFCGEVFPEFHGACRWRTKAWSVLNREIELQICADGVHAERATMYHRAIAGELAELWLFCKRNDSARARVVEDVVIRMAEFQKWIDLGNGTYPLFGDSHGKDNYLRLSAPLIVGTYISGAEGALERGVSDHTWWVIEAPRGAGRAPMKQGSSRESARAFPEGGYFVSRSRAGEGASVLVWDCGPLGYDANRKHGHVDALSMVLSVEGEPLLIDPGGGGARGSGFQKAPHRMAEVVERWRELRMTRAHNTVCVDGQDQAVLGERDEIWNPIEPQVRLWSSVEDYDVMWGVHEGYRRLRDPVWHERLIVSCRDGYWLIFDRLSGRGVHRADVRYHLAPGAVLEAETGLNRFKVTREGAELYLSLFGSGAEIQLEEEHRLGELQGGVPQRIDVLCGSCTAEVPFVLVTLLATATSCWQPRSVQASGSRCMVEVGNGMRSDRVLVRLVENTSGAEVFEGGERTEAPVLIVRHEPWQESARFWTFGDWRSESMAKALVP